MDFRYACKYTSTMGQKDQFSAFASNYQSWLEFISLGPETQSLLVNSLNKSEQILRTMNPASYRKAKVIIDEFEKQSKILKQLAIETEQARERLRVFIMELPGNLASILEKIHESPDDVSFQQKDHLKG